ncbi:unnamed protein product [Ectocarpus sp. CCAP 1310/34]|nr:unnamed protein product [Ectocarpus sp. CCAP 1310/34]
MASGYRDKEPSTREHASAGALAGTAVVVEKEKRIRLEASKRRTHILRAKLNEETEEEKYRLALSKRQHEQQEYGCSVRKNIRSWRKQGSPAPVGDNTVHKPAQPWEQNNRGGTPVLFGTGQSATSPAKLTSTRQGNANVNWTLGNSVGAACTLEEREDAAEMTGISAWTRHEAAGRVETISPKLTAVIDRSYLVSSDVGVDGGAVAGRDSGEQSRGGRWANLPPELRAIKDRWLGSSSEEITPQTATSDIAVSPGATITTPAHGGRQDQHSYFQEYRSRVVPRDKDVRYAHPNILVEGSAPHDNHGRLEGAQTKTPSETVDERKKQGHGCGEDSTFRTISSDSLECSRLVENGLQVTRSAEGRDAHHPRLRQADAESLKDSPQRQHQQQGLLHPIANDNELLGQSSRDDVTPRGSDELGDRTPPHTQEGKDSGLAEDAAAPSIEEWCGEILPLQPGEAVGDPKDGGRRAKVRNQLRDLRNRLTNGATGELPTAASPKPVNVNDALLPAQQATSPASARTQQPWKGGAQPGAGEAEQVGDDGRRRDVHINLGDNKGGAQDTLRPATLVQRVPSHGEGTVNQRVDDTLPLDIAALQERERESTGEQQGVQETFFTRSDVADVEGCSGQGINYDTTNTRSRPSELFDSLDVSARASEAGGGLLPRADGRSDEIGAPAISATARFAPGTEFITPQNVRSPDKAPKNTKIRHRDHALNDQNVSTMAALTVETHSGRYTATSGDASPPRRDRPLIKAVPEEATEPKTRRPPNQATERVPILRPARAVQSPPAVPSRKSTTKPTGDVKCKLREPPHASRLRAPGWGREAVITAILPAKVTPGMAKDGSSPATTASHNGAAPTDPAVLPWDLLTPLTEAATVDERSVVSHGTHGTTKMTPASSVTSGCRPPQEEASDAIQGRVNRRRPHRLQADANPYVAAAAPVVCALESPAETSGFGDGRNQNGSEKRAVWGSGIVASGAHSAPGTTSARSRRRDAPAGGALTSSSAYRASPLSSTADHVGTGGSVFSSASGETNPGRQCGGGYVAAMGRRARSMARCEAARRLAAAMAADRGRPSTPISERARWGKGKESQVEVERRKLLQRRAEYAEELQKKAKEEAMELARRKCLAANASTMLPADPRHVRAGATSATSTVYQQNSTLYDADKSIGGCQGKVPSAIEANFTHDITRPEAIDGRHQDKPPCLAPGSKVNSPVSSRRCDVGVGGDDGGLHRRQKAKRQIAKSTTQEEEEERLTASIARLDTLLREGDGEASRRASNAPMPGGSGGVTRSKSRGRVERSPARAPVGGIAKTRVRTGATKGITSSAGPLVNVEPQAGSVSVAAAVPVHETAVADAGAAIMASPGLFPQIFDRVPAHTGGGREMGRYEPPDAVQQAPYGSSRGGAYREPASHCPVSRAASPLSYRYCADDEQRRPKRTDGGPIDAAPGHYRQEGRRSAGAVSRWVGDGNDRYHYDARAPPRYPAQREERWVPQTPCSPTRYRGVDSSDDNHRGWHDHCRGRSYYRRDDLRAAIDPRDAPGVVDHARWIGESRPEACGDDRSGKTDWIRRDGGTTFQHEDRKGPF